jgi:regulatory protein
MASPYVDALKMLGRRELSEAQVRQRLARRGHDSQAIDEAITRLKDERAIDDTRVAEAMARTATAVKRRGRVRVRRQIEQAGIAPAVARRAVDDTFGALDEEALIESALGKRLRDGAVIADDKELGRLYRYLTAQGFEMDRVMRALSARRR